LLGKVAVAPKRTSEASRATALPKTVLRAVPGGELLLLASRQAAPGWGDGPRSSAGPYARELKDVSFRWDLDTSIRARVG